MRKRAKKRVRARRKNPSYYTYADLHGGIEASDLVPLHFAEPKGPFIEVGDLKEISYITDKGDGFILYQHDFQGVLPRLVLDGKNNLFIVRAGSSYRVTERGIVG